MSPFTPPPRLATAPPRWHPPTSTVSAAVAPGILNGPPSMAITVGATVAAPLLSLLPSLLPPPLLPWFIRTLLVSPTTSMGSGFLAGLPPALPCLWDSSTYSSRSRRGGATARTRPTGDFPRPTERTLHSGTGARWGRGAQTGNGRWRAFGAWGVSRVVRVLCVSDNSSPPLCGVFGKIVGASELGVGLSRLCLSG